MDGATHMVINGGGWWIGFKLITETLKAIDQYNNTKDKIIPYVLKKVGNSDVKILNWLSNSSPKKLADLVSNILFLFKEKSKIANKIINEGVKEIEIILDYIITERKIKKKYCTGGLSNYYLLSIKNKFSKNLIYNKVNPLLGVLLISRNKFPIEKVINDDRMYL